ncbi:TPA: hypothetical protein ON570_004907 [Citrobacter werkmanii]|nr:hypothetical protein [Citrobacter werkmanii]
MHQLFVVTSCGYTLSGLELLMKDAGLPVRVIRVKTPEDVLTTQPEDGNRAVLLVMPVGAPAERAACRLFLWRWMLWRPASQTEATPCLMLCDIGEGSVTGTYPLSRKMSLPALSAVLSGILRCPRSYVRSSSRTRPLTAFQRDVLEATMAGVSVQATAVKLGVRTGAVFASRTALIQKLGLRNRMELMCLNGDDLL